MKLVALVKLMEAASVMKDYKTLEDTVQNVPKELFGVLKLVHVFMFVVKTQHSTKMLISACVTLVLVF